MNKKALYLTKTDVFTPAAQTEIRAPPEGGNPDLCVRRNAANTLCKKQRDKLFLYIHYIGKLRRKSMQKSVLDFDKTDMK